MAKEYFKQLLDSLKAPNRNEVREQILQNIQTTWDELDSQREDVSNILEGNRIFQTLAEIMELNIESWKNGIPAWISPMLGNANDYDGCFSCDQEIALLDVLRRYIMIGKHPGIVKAFSLFAGLASIRNLLLKDEELYNKLKLMAAEVQNIDIVFQNLTYDSEEWQLKVLSDNELVSNLLKTTHWDDVFENLAQHPDAKTLLPPEVLQKASQGTSDACTMIGALLCNDANLSKFQLGEDWIENATKLLHSLVTTGYGENQDHTSFNLLEIVLTIANLSVVDSFKEPLGRKSVELLLTIITEDLPDGQYIQPFVKRSRQEASRALWNFVFIESNGKILQESNGVDRLRITLKHTDDEIMKKNIAGILYMLAPQQQTIATSIAAKGHIMLSYNWGNQPIVIKIANSLKERGYTVWLDIEKMGGSTLEAMAQAIEQADLVLICMSQKYKDSPNCRLEGEYCVNRRVKFLPLMMQHGYRPDGWLGITLGSKLYYDFTTEDNWDTKITELVKAIGESGKNTAVFVHPHALTATESHKKPVSDWTDEDMYEWMKKERIAHHYELFKQHKFDGTALLELKHLNSLQKPMFLFQFCREFGFPITEAGEILRLSAAIRKL